jgi:hypothetical protein
MAHDEELHDHDRGLSHDLPTLLSRWRALGLLGGTGLAVVLTGCGVTGNDDNGAGGSASPSLSGPPPAPDGTVIPEETAGPCPGDGSNGVNSSPRAASSAATSPGASGLETDMVFSDGYSLRLGTVTGSVGDGLTATLNLPV